MLPPLNTSILPVEADEPFQTGTGHTEIYLVTSVHVLAQPLQITTAIEFSDSESRAETDSLSMPPSPLLGVTLAIAISPPKMFWITAESSSIE